jgi:hypothetical protein
MAGNARYTKPLGRVRPLSDRRDWRPSESGHFRPFGSETDREINREWVTALEPRRRDL